MKRQVFFSFHYENDAWRAAQIKNMGIVDGSSTWSSNEWEEVRYKTDERIKDWIDSQMEMRSCLVVLIGEKTADRKWIKYEIERAAALHKGIVGVYIDKLENADKHQSNRGKNPFDYIRNKQGYKLSNYVECLDSRYYTSKNVYSDIKEKLPYYIERAIERRFSY